MASLEERSKAEPADRETSADRPDIPIDRAHLEMFVSRIAEEGNLAALIAFACERGIMYESPAHADPGHEPHPGVGAAIRAYETWLETDGGNMDTALLPGYAQEEPSEEPDIVPLEYVGKWVAWSSDGMHILAVAETSEEAVRLAAEAGEPEPILEIPPDPRRL